MGNFCNTYSNENIQISSILALQGLTEAAPQSALPTLAPEDAGTEVPVRPEAAAPEIPGNWQDAFDEWQNRKYGTPRNCSPLLAHRAIIASEQLMRTVMAAQTGRKAVDRVLKRLIAYDLPEVLPFILDLLQEFDLTIPEMTAAQMLETAESCLVRAFLAASGPLDFRNLLPSIRSTGKQLGKNPADALSAVLKQRFGAKIPGDEQFERILLHRNAYSLNSRTRAALFDSLENGTNAGERIPVFEGLAGKQLSTEHIMPQGLSNVWRSALGADASRIHKTYVNTLCNLTVSGYNNEYSNRPFKEKRDGFVTPEGEAIPGFRDSPYRLSRYVASCKVWTEREMLERNRLLSQRIARVFPMPWDAGVSAPAPTAEKPREVRPAPAPVAAPPAPPAPARTPASHPAAIKGGRVDLMPLEEDSDRTIVSRKMLGYQYKGMSYPAKYWVTMFSGLFGQILKEKKEETIAAIAGNACPGVLSLKHEDGMTILNKKHGIWFANNSSIPAKLAALRALFKALGIRLDECGFYLKAVAGRPATAVQYPQVPKSDRSGKPTLLVKDAACLVRNGRRDKARIAAALQDGAAPSEVPLPQDRPEAEPVPQEHPVSGGEAPAPATSSASLSSDTPEAEPKPQEKASAGGEASTPAPSSAPLSSDTPEAEPEPQEKAAAGGEAPAPAESDPSSRMITIVPDAPEAWKEIAVDVGRIFVLGDGHSGEVFLSRPKKTGTCSAQAFSRLSVLDPRVLETLGLHLHEGPGKHKGPKGVRLENRPEKATSIAGHMGWNISFEAVRLDA